MAFIPGTSGNDPLTGTDQADTIFGGSGNDALAGAAGNDLLSGDEGNDSITTGAGDDTVLGGTGDDVVRVMAGRDLVIAGAGDDDIQWNDAIGDEVLGEDGNDTIVGGDSAADTIFGGDGDDLIRAFTTSPENATAADFLVGGDGSDVVIGGNAADTIEGGAGLLDILTGNDGLDAFVFRESDLQTDDAGGDDGLVGGVIGAAVPSLDLDLPFSLDVITDFDPAEDVVQLVGFEEGFDPLDALSATPFGTVLELGENNYILFLGRVATEFGPDDFVL
jgi:Ca2+-binding RTX toxin-like protein